MNAVFRRFVCLTLFRPTRYRNVMQEKNIDIYLEKYSDTRVSLLLELSLLGELHTFKNI